MDKKDATLAAVSLREALDLGAALGEAQVLQGGAKPYAIMPGDYKIADLSDFLPAPSRAKGTIALGDVQSFIRYVNKHKDAPGMASSAANGSGSDGGADKPGVDADDRQTVIMVDMLNAKFRAFFNHHASDAPGWGDHIAAYNCPLTPEWKTWNEKDGEKMGQEAFAFFIEQNLLDVVEPNGATMLEIVTTLKSVKNVAFDTGVRLNDGQVQLKYHEQNSTTAGAAGQLTIPEEIKLGIPVFMGGAAYAVTAKFRYRIDGPKLVMWYDLLRPHKILEDAVKNVVAEVAKGTEIEPYTTVNLS